MITPNDDDDADDKKYTDCVNVDLVRVASYVPAVSECTKKAFSIHKYKGRVRLFSFGRNVVVCNEGFKELNRNHENA